MKGSVVIVLNICKTLIPCAGIFRIVHSHNMNNHPIDHLYMSIGLGVEGSLFSEFGVH